MHAVSLGYCYCLFARKKNSLPTSIVPKSQFTFVGILDSFRFYFRSFNSHSVGLNIFYLLFGGRPFIRTTSNANEENPEKNRRSLHKSDTKSRKENPHKRQTYIASYFLFFSWLLKKANTNVLWPRKYSFLGVIFEKRNASSTNAHSNKGKPKWVSFSSRGLWPLHCSERRNREWINDKQLFSWSINVLPTAASSAMRQCKSKEGIPNKMKRRVRRSEKEKKRVHSCGVIFINLHLHYSRLLFYFSRLVLVAMIDCCNQWD